MVNFAKLVFALTLLSICYAKSCQSSRSNTKPIIDYVQLAVQSADGYCAINNCNPPVKGWTIHGLWPSQKGVMGPNGCNATAAFDPDDLNNIMNQMEKEWPTLYGGDSTEFWSHEWCKHGTCAMAGISSINSMASYFTSALQLFENLDIENSLSQSGVTHSSEKSYKLSDFTSPFTSSAFFECQKQGDDGQVLYQARFCFTTDLKPTDCQIDWFASISLCDANLPIYYD